MTAEPTVLARRQGRAGRIVLNRPGALNAIDGGMIAAIHGALNQWQDDPAIHAVVIEGAGGKSFCAGGDIRAVRTAVMAGKHAEVEAFFAAEYALNQAMADFPKPIVALVDGYCMGGGIGLSVHGQVRVATDVAAFAMPETAIGLFPDVGATYVLPRLRGQIGLYMGLTGARLNGADAAYAGIATHYATRDGVAGIADAIAADGPAVLAMAARPFDSALAAEQTAIDHCFAADSVPGIVERLERTGTEWAHRTLDMLRAVSPAAVMWTFAAIRAGAGRTLPQCLAAELALTRTVTRHPDFAEGVRAMVVDKDRRPKWRHAALEDVPQAETDAMFLVRTGHRD